MAPAIKSTLILCQPLLLLYQEGESFPRTTLQNFAGSLGRHGHKGTLAAAKLGIKWEAGCHNWLITRGEEGTTFVTAHKQNWDSVRRR